MSDSIFHKAYRQQVATGLVNVDDLSFLWIEESSQDGGITSDSLSSLIDLFKLPFFQKQANIHSMTTAVWTDTSVFSDEQLLELKSELIRIDFSKLEFENSYSLCDMVCNLYPPNSAKEILTALATQNSVAEAAAYSISQIKEA